VGTAEKRLKRLLAKRTTDAELPKLWQEHINRFERAVRCLADFVPAEDHDGLVRALRPAYEAQLPGAFRPTPVEVRERIVSVFVREADVAPSNIPATKAELLVLMAEVGVAAGVEEEPIGRDVVRDRKLSQRWRTYWDREIARRTTEDELEHLRLLQGVDSSDDCVPRHRFND
jgi:hypothetical protein